MLRVCGRPFATGETHRGERFEGNWMFGAKLGGGTQRMYFWWDCSRGLGVDGWCEGRDPEGGESWCCGLLFLYTPPRLFAFCVLNFVKSVFIELKGFPFFGPLDHLRCYMAGSRTVLCPPFIFQPPTDLFEVLQCPLLLLFPPFLLPRHILHTPPLNLLPQSLDLLPLRQEIANNTFMAEKITLRTSDWIYGELKT